MSTRPLNHHCASATPLHSYRSAFDALRQDFATFLGAVCQHFWHELSTILADLQEEESASSTTKRRRRRGAEGNLGLLELISLLHSGIHSMSFG
jgi:hypothetical protein